MILAPASQSGELLWRLLPQIYRRWDGTHGKDPLHPVKLPEQRGDLAEYLDSYGILLDRIRATLEQRLRDTSPETCQPWLIPYFADLLDVHLVSPDLDGQRAEVARAVLWRQRKGTIDNTLEVAREVGRFQRSAWSPLTRHQQTRDGDSRKKRYRFTLAPSPMSGSVTINADQTDSAAQRVDDDGAGHLKGVVDPFGTNTIDYHSGAVDVTFSAAPLTGTRNIVVDYQEARYQAHYPTLVLHEGFRRVVTTARVDVPLPPLHTLELRPGQYQEYASDQSLSPIQAAQRPGLSVGTVDFRKLSRVREVPTETLSSHVNAFGDQAVRWQQANPQGIPCHRDSYQDHSVRTVDLRTPTWTQGHHHPHRVLAYTAPRDGFFTPGQLELSWGWWEDLFDQGELSDPREDNLGNRIQERVFGAAGLVLIERVIARDGRRTEQKIAGRSTQQASLVIRRETVGVEAFMFDAGMEYTHLKTDALAVTMLRGFGKQGTTAQDQLVPPEESVPVLKIASDLQIEGSDAPPLYVFERMVLAGGGRLGITNTVVRFHQAAVKHLQVETFPVPEETKTALTDLRQVADQYFNVESLSEAIGVLEPETPSVILRDALLDKLTLSGNGLCRFEYCTILTITEPSSEKPKLQASDCILLQAKLEDFAELYLRYSCTPWLDLEDQDLPSPSRAVEFEETMNRRPPLFLSADFGTPGCAVLHPATHPAIRFGAEDGGEMGVYHHRHYVLREQATLDKLRAFLPVTQEPVLIPQAEWLPPLPPYETACTTCLPFRLPTPLQPRRPGSAAGSSGVED